MDCQSRNLLVVTPSYDSVPPLVGLTRVSKKLSHITPLSDAITSSPLSISPQQSVSEIYSCGPRPSTGWMHGHRCHNGVCRQQVPPLARQSLQIHCHDRALPPHMSCSVSLWQIPQHGSPHSCRSMTLRTANLSCSWMSGYVASTRDVPSSQNAPMAMERQRNGFSTGTR